MNVIGHQRISVNVSFMLDGRSAQDREETLVVGLRSKDVTAVNTSLNDVVRYPWSLHARSARHVGQGLHEPSQKQELRFSA